MDHQSWMRSLGTLSGLWLDAEPLGHREGTPQGTNNLFVAEPSPPSTRAGLDPATAVSHVGHSASSWASILDSVASSVIQAQPHGTSAGPTGPNQATSTCEERQQYDDGDADDDNGDDAPEALAITPPRSASHDAFFPARDAGRAARDGDWAARGDDARPNAAYERRKATNRAAATRYRRKKRARKLDLETHGRKLEEERGRLQEAASALRADLVKLKHEILRHGGCGYAPIDQYIEKSARKVVRDVDS